MLKPRSPQFWLSLYCQGKIVMVLHFPALLTRRNSKCVCLMLRLGACLMNTLQTTEESSPSLPFLLKSRKSAMELGCLTLCGGGTLVEDRAGILTSY